MGQKFRVAVLGLIHDHVWDNLQSLRECERAELVAAWDENAALRERVEREYGCRTYDRLDQLFETETLEAVYVFSSNAGGEELTIQAAERGLHALIEKPMAATLRGANCMLEAAVKSDVRLMLNWPFAWWPQLQHALTMAQDGTIGEVWQVRYRAAHQGPEELGCSEYFCRWLFDPELNGGGALMDYCCYGVNLARVVLGSPQSVTGTTATLCKTWHPVEDNALIVMNYPRAMAVAEASWTQIGKLTSYQAVIYGTTGTLMVDPRRDGRLLLATQDVPDGEAVSVPESPPHLQNSAEHFFWGLDTGEPYQPLCRPDVGRDVQAILAAAQQSAASGGREVKSQ